jgi:transcriptional regulator with XRE-family HTH domain
MDYDVGTRLRTLRQIHGLSQRELAKRTGVTNGMISLIEQGRVSPSVSSLTKVLDGLPMTLADFFTLDLAAAPQAFYPRAELAEVSSGSVERRLVGAHRPSRAFAVLHERYAPGADTAADTGADRMTTGDLGGIVVRGRIELTVSGLTRMLGPGDGFYFSCALPHRFRNVGLVECEIICAASGRGPES